MKLLQLLGSLNMKHLLTIRMKYVSCLRDSCNICLISYVLNMLNCSKLVFPAIVFATVNKSFQTMVELGCFFFFFFSSNWIALKGQCGL